MAPWSPWSCAASCAAPSWWPRKPLSSATDDGDGDGSERLLGAWPWPRPRPRPRRPLGENERRERLRASAVSRTGSFSPVRLEASMVRSTALVTRMSAGMRSPVVNMTRSPGTSEAASTLDDEASRTSSAGVSGSA